MHDLRVGNRSGCDVCTLRADDQFVPPEGPVPCSVMFVGEAPGANEVRLKRPFVGASGIILNDTMREAGFSRREVYITNSCLCRPPNNRKPKETEIGACRKRLMVEIKQVQPKLIVLLGHTAYESMMNKKGPTLRYVHGSVKSLYFISGDLGKEFEVRLLYTYHPQATKYSGMVKAYFKQDLKKAKQILSGLLVP